MESSVQEVVQLIKKNAPVVYENAERYFRLATAQFNEACRGLEPWQIAILSVIVYSVLNRIYRWVYYPDVPTADGIFTRLKNALFFYVKKIPLVRKLIEKEMSKTMKDIEKELLKTFPGETKYHSLPETGIPSDRLIKQIRDIAKYGSIDWQHGKTSGCVYHGGQELAKLSSEVYELFAWSNPLHPSVFPGVRKMESEVVSMVLNLFNAGPDAAGNVTSGGTESILMACKAYREQGRERGITRPEIVMAESAHAAFDKAGDYFGIKIVKIPVKDKNHMTVDPRAVKAAITSNTIAIVGSAPAFPHGAMDPIEDLAKIAKKYNIGLHVDCCLGSFVVAHMEKAGFSTPCKFDFRVPGVTSISCDTHKYGFAPKGSSVIMYHSANLRRHQYFKQPDWQGGIYASPSVAGSRPGAIIAAAWATMMTVGSSGYIDATRRIVQTARYIETGIRGIPGLRIVGRVDTSVVAFGSDVFDINRICEELVHKRGWELNVLQFPASMHICVTLPHTQPGVADQFLKDLKESVAPCLINPKEKAKGAGAVYGMAASIPDRTIIGEIAAGFLDACTALNKN
eukprot:TRINITY_DN2322_c0_g1::TRINITY_DN2322_c0_g1_i1::g.20720::m.20720 TRINITY_DN2322_c0_g1::TRINITY_DN2322_c0_g1_i1::g.20720  ORF type:complete len:585 (+),score=145.22,sp/Q8CHN6/SGPL1_RAT/48.80/0.0,Pyridoxal_deC/PF00282.14/1.1e-22,Aminotran_5/PF00266.14/5.4e-11,DegT_DnrJ_EryC1/PF01041.12/3.4e-06,Aminotran_1_2/PF00155.16/4.3e-05,Beta_elim_lyase/PF01212.16/0.0018,Cys_Met_Meta_PP/PF01053.15/0.0049,SLA_LP_auto_ag/PF05889.8/0.011 TRINITY_DN2322_c0_g1_i1:49-1755(+)